MDPQEKLKLEEQIKNLENSVDFYKNSFLYFAELNQLNAEYLRRVHESILVCIPEDKRRQLCSYLFTDFNKFMVSSNILDSKYKEKINKN